MSNTTELGIAHDSPYDCLACEQSWIWTNADSQSFVCRIIVAQSKIWLY
jgi:hypothetical protein